MNVEPARVSSAMPRFSAGLDRADGMDPAAFRRTLSHYPTGVCVITAVSHAGEPLALVVGSFTSASLAPPLIGFLPAKSSGAWERIEKVGRFCVNVLASDQENLCRRMARPGPGKFENVAYDISAHGLPVLANAVAHIECLHHSATDAGDHWFVLGKVLSMHISREASPLIFHRGKYGEFVSSPSQ